MLLKAQPRVEAPADYEFKLRARIARAEAEQVRSTGLLGKVWEGFLAQTFSWGQAASAMAAVAVLITVSTYYIRQDGGAPGTTIKNDVAVATIGQKASEQPLPIVESNPAAKVESVAPVRSAPAHFSNRVNRTVAFKATAPAEAAPLKDIASADNMPRFYSRETRQVVQDRNAFGAELVSVNSAKSAAPALSF